MTYHESLWRNAPEGATHWGLYEGEHGVFLKARKWSEDIAWGWNEKHQSWKGWSVGALTDIHKRPTAYQSVSQLVEAYRKEHGAEIEEWLVGVNKGENGDEMRQAEASVWLAARYMALAEHLLAAERERIDGERK